jgi:YegS/Rv2252/BmrU family lipid kinase
MSRHCSLIINPVSGGYSEPKLRDVRNALESAGFSCELLTTKSPEDAASFASQACQKRDEPFVVAVGGDGTVNGVINGLKPGKAVLAVLPLGTANVLARELGLRSVEDAVARIVRGSSRALTVGVLRGNCIERRFVLMAGVGIDGRIVEEVRPGEKRILGKGAYILSAARRLARWEKGMFAVVAGGRKVDCHSVIICNAARYGGGFVLAPDADIFDPCFQVACMTGDTRASYVRLLISLFSGRAKNPLIEMLAAADVSVFGSAAVQVDGDYFCRGPVEISAEPGFARLIV